MRLNSRTLFQGRIIRLSVDDVQLPNGARCELEIVHHPGGAAAVAFNDRDEVCLLRQYRHAIGGWVWELPAGKLEPNEAPEFTARRELQEEAGVSAHHWESLGQFIPSPGILTERVHLFLARDLRAVAATPESGEVLEVHWLPLQQALARVDAGEISDGKTVVALLKLARRPQLP